MTATARLVVPQSTPYGTRLRRNKTVRPCTLCGRLAAVGTAIEMTGDALWHVDCDQRLRTEQDVEA